MKKSLKLKKNEDVVERPGHDLAVGIGSVENRRKSIRSAFGGRFEKATGGRSQAQYLQTNA